jgi:hypothetical protein
MKDADRPRKTKISEVRRANADNIWQGQRGCYSGRANCRRRHFGGFIADHISFLNTDAAAFIEAAVAQLIPEGSTRSRHSQLH